MVSATGVRHARKDTSMPQHGTVMRGTDDSTRKESPMSATHASPQRKGHPTRAAKPEEGARDMAHEDRPVIAIDPTVRPANMDLHEKRREAGRKGGMATLAKYGREHMRTIGRAGFQAYADSHHDGVRAAAAKSIMGFRGWRQHDPSAEFRHDMDVARGDTKRSGGV